MFLLYLIRCYFNVRIPRSEVSETVPDREAEKDINYIHKHEQLKLCGTDQKTVFPVLLLRERWLFVIIFARILLDLFDLKNIYQKESAFKTKHVTETSKCIFESEYTTYLTL